MKKIVTIIGLIRQKLSRRLLVGFGMLSISSAACAVLIAVAETPHDLLAAGILLSIGVVSLYLAPEVEAKTLVEQSRELIVAGKFQDALWGLNRAIELSPRLVCAYIVRSAAYAGISQIDLAVEDAEHAVRLAPHLPDTRLVRARLYSHRGLYDAAIRDLHIGIRAKPDWSTGYMELAQLQVRLQDYESSLATLRDLNVNSSSEYVRCDSLILTGWVYEEKLCDLDGAIAAYTRAIAMSPDRKIGYLRRAQAYRTRGDFYPAAEDLLRAAQREPTAEDAGQYHWLQAACYWGRYTITNDNRDLNAWIIALEKSMREDVEPYCDQSRQWLASVQEQRLRAESADNKLGEPPRLQIFPN
ncbi:MAG: hypothetical protein ABI947_23730 [Chloroflexota bacterium]